MLLFFLLFFTVNTIITNTEGYKLETPKMANAQFGWESKITKDFAFVGAPWYRSTVNDTLYSHGVVFVYKKRINGKYTFLQKILPPNPTISKSFGTDISVFENDLIIGADMEQFNPRGNLKREQPGAVYTYRYNSKKGKWELNNKIVSIKRYANERFGDCVAMGKNFGVISTNDNRSRNNLLNILKKDTLGNWIIINTLELGYNTIDELQIVGDQLAFIGNPKSDSIKSSEVFIANINKDGTLSKERIITHKHLKGHHFADSGFELNANFCIVQSLYSTVNDACPNKGMVYVYKKNEAGNWIETDRKYAPHKSKCNFYGRSIAMNNYTVVIGSMGSNINEEGKDSPYMGAVYVYKLDSETGKMRITKSISGPDKTTWNKFGFSVDVYGNDIIIGSRLESYELSKNAGRAYIYTSE